MPKIVVATAEAIPIKLTTRVRESKQSKNENDF
jgi:hypothetical protein